MNRARRCASRRSMGLTSLRATSSTRSSPDVEIYQALVSWLHAEGGNVDPAVQLTVEDGGAGRGLLSRRQVAAGERLIVVPASAQLSCSSGSDGADTDSDKALRALMNTVNPDVRGMRLGLRMLQEKVKSESAEGSKFGIYIKSLPSSHDDMPLYYAEDIPEIQFSNVEQQAVAAITELLHLTQRCLSIHDTAADPFMGAAIDIGALLWATASASSRAVEADAEDERLIPIVDLINHSFDANCLLEHAAEVAGHGALAVTARKDIGVGESLRLSYGDVSQQLNEFSVI